MKIISIIFIIATISVAVAMWAFEIADNIAERTYNENVRGVCDGVRMAALIFIVPFVFIFDLFDALYDSEELAVLMMGMF